VQTSDGGYVVAGYSKSEDGDVTGNHGDFDFWVVKLSEGGSLQWQKSLGGSDDDRANSIERTSDGGYIIAGGSGSRGGYVPSVESSGLKDGDVTGNHGDDDFWVVKLSQDGALQWQKTFGGSRDDVANSIMRASDGGYVVIGYSESEDGDVTGNHGDFWGFKDFWVVKLSEAGELQWQKSLGGSDNDDAKSIMRTSDGGYVVAGGSWSDDGDVTGNHGYEDFWVVKLDQGGSLQWQKSLGGSGGDVANSVMRTSDGGYIVVGGSGSSNGDVTGNHGGFDFWVVKLKP
jgi:hypothetical protein